MPLFERPDGEGEFIGPRPRRARREKDVPKRQVRLRTQLEWHKMRHKEGFSVAEIAGIFRRSEPTVRAGLRKAADAVARKAADDRSEDPDD